MREEIANLARRLLPLLGTRATPESPARGLARAGKIAAGAYW
jgi:hypothetical protein